MVFQKSTPQEWFGRFTFSTLNSHDFFHREVPHFSRGGSVFSRSTSPWPSRRTPPPPRPGARPRRWGFRRTNRRPNDRGADRCRGDHFFEASNGWDRFHEIININYLMVPIGFKWFHWHNRRFNPYKNHMMVTIWWVSCDFCRDFIGFNEDLKGIDSVRGFYGGVHGDLSGTSWDLLGFTVMMLNDVLWVFIRIAPTHYG